MISSATPHTMEPKKSSESIFWNLRNRKMWLAWGMFAAGILLTWIGAVKVSEGIEFRAKQDFDFFCNEIKNKIVTRLYSHAQLLRSGSAYIEGSVTVTRNEWRQFIDHQNIEKNLPGIQGIGYSTIIPQNELLRHEQKIRSEGFPLYSVKPSEKRDVYTSIIYLEPFSGRNLRAFGYDMFSEPVRRKAMEFARDYNLASLSGKITLIQETDQDIQAGTLMYVPVYKKTMPVSTVEERRSAIRGWVYSPYRMNDLMKGILGEYAHHERKQFHLQIYDDSVYQAEHLLYDSEVEKEHSNISSSLFTVRSSIVFNGHVWYLQFKQHENSLSHIDYSKVWIIAVGGIGGSVLLTILFIVLVNTNDRAQRLADVLTKDLKESEQKYRVVFNNEIYAICIFDFETLILLDVNEAYIHMYGYNRKELLSGMTINDINADHHASDVSTAKAAIEGTTYIPLRYHRKKNGTIFPVEIVGGPYVWQGRNVMFALTHDITERKQAEESLRQSQIFLNNIIDHSPYSLWISDEHGTLIRLNQACRNILHLRDDEVIGKYNILNDNLIEEQGLMPLVRNVFEKSISVNFVISYDTAAIKGFEFDKTTRVVLNVHISPIQNQHGKVTNAIIQHVDITESKRSEEALRNAQKLESIGTLAAGIAHDFNNLLVGILGQSSLALKKLPKESPAADNIQKSIKASEHAADLVRQLLAYSGKGKFFTTEIDLNALILENFQIFEVSIPKTAELRQELISPPPRIIGDIGQIQQVIMNLIINAGEAMGTDPGFITIRTKKFELREHNNDFSKYTNLPLSPGKYALVQVSDTGTGISKDLQSRIFDPFFTTKFLGRGLGLPAVLGIVRGHNGGIRIESEEGRGTMFEIILPMAIDSTVNDISQIKKDEIEPSTHESEQKTILIIDDDPFVYELLEDILTEINFKVIGALDPLKGIELYRHNYQTVSLVVLDFSMPRLNGKDTFEELLKINKDVKVLLSSGYNEEEIMANFDKEQPKGFFKKPYQADAFVERVLSILSL